MLSPNPRRRPHFTACALVVAASLGANEVASQAAAADAQVDEASIVEQISKYCTTSWRNAGIEAASWDDCTQEAFAELLSRVERPGLRTAIERPESEARRELNRTVWCVVQRWRRARSLGSIDGFDVRDARSEDPLETVERADVRERIEDAAGDLSPRQNQIVGQWLEGYSVAEIADGLETTAARVSDEKYKAFRRLRRSLQPLV